MNPSANYLTVLAIFGVGALLVVVLVRFLILHTRWLRRRRGWLDEIERRARHTPEQWWGQGQ